jgi:hypothetical protein
MNQPKPIPSKGKRQFQHDRRTDTPHAKPHARDTHEPDDGGESTLSGQPRETGGKRDEAPHLER